MSADGDETEGPAQEEDRLESWKEIAVFLNRGVRTVQRWELHEQLPVHRHAHAVRGSVFAHRSELQRWRQSRRWTDAGEPVHSPTIDESRRRTARAPRLLVLGGVTLAIGTLALAWGTWETATGQPGDGDAAGIPRSLASEPTLEGNPTLSPDGQFVAYNWYQPNGGAHIYIKATSGGQAWALPLDGPPPADRVDSYPQWSPDGRWIAFLREVRPAIWDLHVVASKGGRSRALLEISSASVSWFPDSRSLAVVNHPGQGEAYSVFVVETDTGQIRQRLTNPQSSTFGDWQCAVSPDGTRLAVARFNTRADGDIHVTTVRDGEAGMRRLTALSAPIDGLDWTPDGQSIVFASGQVGRMSLWRVSADPTAGDQPHFVTGTEGGLARPTVARDTATGRGKLAYSVSMARTHVWHWTFGGDHRNRPSTVFVSSSSDYHPAFAPDGQHLAFVSTRSGWPEVWSARLDGTELRQLTFRQSTTVLTPRWSPDGQWITFTSNVDGNLDVYFVRRDGSAMTRLTSDLSEESNASWSRDGRWIYFRSTRTGIPRLWRMPPDRSRVPTPVTSAEGSEGVESKDGRTLYFVKRDGDPGLWAKPTAGGTEELLIGGYHVWETYWDVTSDGVLFLERAVEDRRNVQKLVLFDFKTRALRDVGDLPTIAAAVQRVMSASPDGHSVLWSQSAISDSDVMIIDPWP